jgi:undecaprenyl-diphosphatase
MAFTSDMGDWIGQGWRLAFVSIVLLAIAWVLKKPNITIVAIQTLIAHGIAALLANVLKHVIGRPRPKFVHSGDWEMSFSLVSGLDSFPSGHSTASFAIATVLARRFPPLAPVLLAVAIFVGLSRILRGSHFLTDVIGGAVIGILSGYLATTPVKQWRVAIQDGIHYAAVGTSAIFAILWVLARPMESGLDGILFLALGISMVVAGLWIRRIRWFRQAGTGESRISAPLIMYGLAAMTTAPMVVSSVGFACMGSWLYAMGRHDDHIKESTRWSIIRESAVIGAVTVAILILVDGRGVLPFP